jgi:hypothetical protein
VNLFRQERDSDSNITASVLLTQALDRLFAVLVPIVGEIGNDVFRELVAEVLWPALGYRSGRAATFLLLQAQS